VAKAVAASAPRALSSPDPEANDYVLRVLLAGTHSARRVFSVRGANGTERRIDLPPHVPESQTSLLTFNRIDSDIASIRIENSLGDGRLVKAFDDALVSARDMRGIVLDLRNTPSGGDTDVAEPILGRFVKGRPEYQRQFVPRPGKVFPRDSTVRWVRERGLFRLTCDLVVLCDRWTGSMGEGMTIGLDGMNRAKIVGTRMAGLCGATEVFTLPHSGIGARFPTLRLYHLNGTPREKFVPGVLVDLAHAHGDDPIFARGLAVLREGWR
jgi:carboxyl-terminal processing protease